MSGQALIKGRGALQRLPAVLQAQGCREVLFVTGRHLLQAGAFQALLAQLDLPYRLLHPQNGVLEVTAIPSFATLDAVVAIGGGKAMDFAKGIIHQHAQPVFLVAVPTTAGSGSEATPIAVFYRGQEKISLDAPALLPQVAVLDPALLDELPSLQRAVSGADALAQSIESVWSVHSTQASERLALEAMALVWKALPGFVQGGNGEAAEQMLNGAYLAGRAIALTRTTGPHALSYYLTAVHQVPHGQAVALTLPLFFLYNDREETRPQLEKIFRILGVANAAGAFDTCRRFFAACGLATTLAELGLAGLSIGDWLQSVNQQRFANNPVAFDAARLNDIFQRYL